MTPFSEYGVHATPLVHLERIAPPGVRIFAKCEWHLPTGSVKDRVAAAMFDAAKSGGLLQPGVRLLEASSGNTGIAIARIARLHEVPFTVILPDNVTTERLALLSALGAEVIFSPGAEGSNGAVRRADEMAEAGGYLMLHQYANQANPEAHRLTTGPEISAGLAAYGVSRLDAFVAALGTGGTITGVARHLALAHPGTVVVAAEPPVGEAIQGLRSLSDGYVPPVFDPSVLDAKLLVRTEASISMARRLMSEEGLFVGPSSGAAVHAALKVAARLEPGSVVVTVLPDAGWKYLSTGLFGASGAQGEELSDTTLW